MRKVSFFLLMNLWGTLSATAFYDIDTTQLIRCNLSGRHHNRIAVSGGRILKVIYPEGVIAIQAEETSGQIFVDSLSHENVDPITISIVTSEGVVQDLELIFSDIPSEVVILGQVCEVICSEAEDIKCACDDPVSAVCIVDSILAGSVPSGYVASDEVSDKIKIKRCIQGINTAKFVGDEEIIYVWDIENRSFMTTVLKESDLNFCNSLWVYISKNKLQRNERALAIVSVRKV